jgi:hypothetical protein
MDQWNGQQRAVAIKMFYMFGFLQFLLSFQKFPFSCVTLYFKTTNKHNVLVFVAQFRASTQTSTTLTYTALRLPRFYVRQSVRKHFVLLAYSGAERVLFKPHCSLEHRGV